MPDSLPTETPETGDERDEIIKVAEATLDQISPPELEPYNISFVNYIKDKCSVNGMDGKNAQMAIKIIKNIGLNFKSQEHFSSEQMGNKLEIKQVFNSSPYDDCYKELPTEIQDSQEVKEIKYKDTRLEKEVDLRIFYYTLSNIFYMLAITAGVHENLDHKPYQHKNKKRHW